MLFVHFNLEHSSLFLPPILGSVVWEEASVGKGAGDDVYEKVTDKWKSF